MSKLLNLGLFFHFIKQRGGNAEKGEPIAHGKNSNADPVIDSVSTETVTHGNPQGYRFASFYLKKKQEALSLIWLLKHHPNALLTVRGLDVCTDELAVPNWVLAPIVNEVRQQSITTSAILSSTQGIEIKPLHMTAHAGEDFIHLFTGLRNIDEAIELFKLTQGDRLGHAVALGIEPREWAKSSGKIPVKSEDRLFDLVWLWSWFGQSLKYQNHTQQISMEHEVAMLTNQLFAGVVKPIPSIFDLHLLMSHLSDVDKLTATGFPEGAQPMCHLKKELLYQYLTSPKVFQQGQQVVWIDPYAERELLLQVQNQLREKVGTLGVTIEVNPSSNLLTGDLSDLESHPLWRLRPPIPIDGVPPVSICIGSDDPVVFSTDLRQEYQRVFDALITAGLSNEQAERWVDETRASGLNCRFTIPVK